MAIVLNAGKLSVAAVCSAIAITAASSANAVVFNLEVPGQLTSTESGATTIDFESGAPTTGFATYEGGEVVTGSEPGLYAKPFGLPENTAYLTVGKLETAIVSFAKPLEYFGLYFGSADTYNAISFFKGNQLVNSFTGAEILPPGDGNQVSDTTNRYVNFFAEAGESFDTVRLDSANYAFESDNHAYKAVPEPSSVLGVLAFGAFGAGSLLKRKLKQKV